MKAVAFILTILLHFSIIYYSRLLDNFTPIVSIMSLSVIAGAVLRFGSKDQRLQQIGWGIFFGSLTSPAILAGFMIWMLSEFH